MCWMSADAVAGEHRLLDPLQVPFHVPGHLQVGVDHAGADRVRHRPRAGGQQRGAALDVGADAAQRTGGAVPHRDGEAVTEQHHDVPGVDHLGGVGQLVVLHVPGGAQDQQRDRPVALHCGPVPVGERLFDGQLVEAEGLADRGEHGRAGIVQSQPDEGVAAVPRPGVRVGVVRLTGFPAAVDVDGAVDHGVRVGPAGGGGVALDPSEQSTGQGAYASTGPVPYRSLIHRVPPRRRRTAPIRGWCHRILPSRVRLPTAGR